MATGGGRNQGGVDGDLRASAVGGSPAPVGAGGEVRARIEVALDVAAAGTVVAVVEPVAPARLAGGRASRVILRPGEARTVEVLAFVPVEARRLVVRVAGAGRQVDVRVALGAEPAPAPVVAVPEEVAPPSAAIAALFAAPEPAPVPTPVPAPEPTRAPWSDPDPDEPLDLEPEGGRSPVLVAVGALIGLLLLAAVAIGAAGLLGDDDGDGSPAVATTSTTALDDPTSSSELPGAGAPDLGATVAVTGTIDLAGADPATVEVTVTIFVDEEPVVIRSDVDADGRYELDLPAGIQRVVATAPGYLEAAQTVVVADVPVEAQRITLLPA